MNTQRVKINIIPGGYLPVFCARQYDHGIRVFEFEVYKNAERYIIPGNYTAHISGVKPDGTGFVYNATIEDNVIYADCAEQMTAVAGKYRCDLVLTYSENDEAHTIGTHFVMNITDSAGPDDSQISESDYSLFQQTVDAVAHAPEIATARDEAVAAASAASTAASTASTASAAAVAANTNAQSASGNAATSAEQAYHYSVTAQSYAVGGTGQRPGEDENNAEYYFNEILGMIENVGIAWKEF